jgi:hypothetical protein
MTHKILTLSLLSVSLAASLSACSNSSAPEVPVNIEITDRAAADIGNLQDNGAQMQSFETPPGFKQGDKLITYEGPGWESDKTAFRIYLDGRNALDIFGKKLPATVLNSVGRGEDYHEMADWGMDILKVGNSLGAGGFGVYEGGKVRQIGTARSYKAEVVQDNTETAAVKVTHVGSRACRGTVAATYTIKAGERMSRVQVEGGCALPYATGLIIHPNTRSIVSDGTGEWQYKARYGAQSLVPDNLGLAIFYKSSDVQEISTDEDDDYVVFKPRTAPDYYTAAAWAQEPGGITTETQFRSWLEQTRITLNASSR